MNTNVLYLLVALMFSGCLASLSHDKSQELTGQAGLDEKFLEAARSGSLDVMTDLLKQGADVNARNNNGETVLHKAVQIGSLACVKALIEAKVGVNACNTDGFTALHWAARRAHLDCLEALIEAKADVNSRNNNGDTALYWAVERGHLACVKALIEAKADVNSRNNNGNTALHYAAISGFPAYLKALIEAKADINTRNNRGKTALDWASKSGHLDCVKALVKCSYMLLPSEEVVAASRKRIFRFLGVFVGLRNQHPRLAGLQDTTLQYEILSWDRDLQEDLVVILLAELTKGKVIKNVALIRSKEAAVSYLSKKVKEMAPTILDGVANLGDLIKEGLDERITQLKSKVSVELLPSIN